MKILMKMNIRKELLEMIPTIRLVKNRIKINEFTRIEDDLFIYGDDAAEFMLEYSKKFNVDLSNFIFERYYTKETSFYNIYKFIPCLNKNRMVITLGDLENGIRLGKLDDDIINSNISTKVNP